MSMILQHIISLITYLSMKYAGPVSRGRLKLINYSAVGRWIPKNNQKQQAQMVTFTDFEKHLQCSSPEPDMDGTRGGWSMMKMAPPTKESLELICAWAESRCHPWVTCKDHADSYKAGKPVHI